MSSIYLPYQKLPRWNADRATVAHNCARMGLPVPVLAMPMWEGAGNKVYDYSGNQAKYFNELSGNTIWKGKSIYFDGADSYVKLRIWNGEGKVTLSAIFTPEEAIGSDEQISAADSDPDGHRTFQLRRNSSGKLNFIVFVGGAVKSVTGGTTLTTGKKWHVCGVNDGTYCHVYVNGVEDATPVSSGAMDNDPAAWAIGARPRHVDWSSPAEDFQGEFELFCSWNCVLNPIQVQTFRNNPFGMFEPIRSSQWIVPLGATTAAPTTLSPTTLAPTTLSPTSLAPTTAAPADIRSAQVLAQVEWVEGTLTTVAPTSLAPTSLAPTSLAPTTAAPTTAAPTTPSPTTAAPTTIAPTTSAPTTTAPTTAAPTTIAPTTAAPTSAPTTVAPTVLPTTLAPTLAPTTLAPTTVGPTTTTLTTIAPTTAAPEIICIKTLNSIITEEIPLKSVITKEIRSDGHLC